MSASRSSREYTRDRNPTARNARPPPTRIAATKVDPVNVSPRGLCPRTPSQLRSLAFAASARRSRFARSTESLPLGDLAGLGHADLAAGHVGRWLTRGSGRTERRSGHFDLALDELVHELRPQSGGHEFARRLAALVAGQEAELEDVLQEDRLAFEA